MSFTYEISEEEISNGEEMMFVHDSEPLEEGEYYTLDDGEVYHEKDVIVGTEEIRDQYF